MIRPVFHSLNSKKANQNLTSDEIVKIAEDAYIFAYPMLENYKIMFGQSIAEQAKTYKGPMNHILHNRELLDANYRDIVGANNNTLYTVCWMDLQAEPLVFTVPDFPDNRFNVFQFVDMYTHNFAYVGSRVTGQKAGKYLIVGPNWEGELPGGFDQVFKSESQFVLLLGRIYINGKDELESVHALQDQVQTIPLSVFNGNEISTLSEIDFPIIDEGKMESASFISYLNFLLEHVQIHPSEKDLFNKFSKIGIGPGNSFVESAWDPSILEAMNEGVKTALAKIKEQAPKIGNKVNGWNSFGSAFGNREFMNGKYLDRASGAMAGIYGNDLKENATYTAFEDSEGEALDGSKHKYILKFPEGQIPPVNGFWSITMYDPQGFMIHNPINRYSIFGEDALLIYGEGNSLELHFQHESPGNEKESNWLTAPNGVFVLAMRVYWPKDEILDGSWSPPVIVKVNKH